TRLHSNLLPEKDQLEISIGTVNTSPDMAGLKLTKPKEKKTLQIIIKPRKEKYILHFHDLSSLIKYATEAL
ncbi:hypothetical protein, partial [Vibrio parahaemolyticus]|uniref:hypothetical protein n=1 Tax=Vibrio parahaemolyticus TaxID=670 RepID=UPI001C5DAA41